MSDQTNVGLSASIGTERIILLPDGDRFKIERQIRCEGGVTHHWDEASLDYVDVPGHWETVETLARGLATREDARLFMVQRERPE